MTPNSSISLSGIFHGRGWVLLLRGLTAIAFGLLAFAWPGVTLARLTLLFGIYAVVHGILSVGAAFGARGQHGCMLLATEGIIGLFAGALTLRTTLPSPMAAIFLIWLWSIVTGVIRIVEAIRLRKDIPGDIWLALSGVVTVIFGLMVVSRHFVGVIGLALLIAIFAVICGVFEVLLGWEMRAIRHGSV